VVETEKEASLLLEKGELKKRVTFLPLNKIQGNAITSEKLAKIKRVAGETEAQLALHYIDYDQKMQPAMNFVFGNTILCQTKDIAQAIAFDKSIHVRCITKDGDVYDPAGTMTGGTLNPMNSKGNSLLFTSSQIKRKKENMAPLIKEMEEMDSRLGQMDKLKKDTHRMENEIELKTHQLFLYRDQRNSDPTLKVLLHDLMYIFDYNGSFCI
jgi:structural maintenance of chromosome 2